MNVFLYIDATTGGMALQIILSGIVGGLVFIKLFARNIMNTILRRKSSDEDGEETSTPEAETPAAGYKADSSTS